MLFQIMAVTATLHRFRAILDHYLVLSVPGMALIGFLGSAACILQIVRSLVGNTQYERTAPPLMINFALVLFFAWAEIRSFVGSSRSSLERTTARGALQQVAGWLSSAGWIAFLAFDRYGEWQRLRFKGSVLEHVAEIPHQQFIIVGRLAALGLVFGSVAIALIQLRQAPLQTRQLGH